MPRYIYEAKSKREFIKLNTSMNLKIICVKLQELCFKSALLSALNAFLSLLCVGDTWIWTRKKDTLFLNHLIITPKIIFTSTAIEISKRKRRIES